MDNFIINIIEESISMRMKARKALEENDQWRAVPLKVKRKVYELYDECNEFGYQCIDALKRNQIEGRELRETIDYYLITDEMFDNLIRKVCESYDINYFAICE